MFQVKICGITTKEDAGSAVASKADALGFNFYPQSKRYLKIENALEVVQDLPSHISRVGVFVNAPHNQVEQAVESLALDWVQLHGDETPEFLATLSSKVPLLRAYRLGQEGLDQVLKDLQACQKAGRTPDAILIDALVPGEFGGTGAAVDWKSLTGWRSRLGSIPLVLAGGLKPGNVATAIDSVKPTAVDTASGVEISPRQKDPILMQKFVAAAQMGLAQVAPPK